MHDAVVAYDYPTHVCLSVGTIYRCEAHEGAQGGACTISHELWQRSGRLKDRTVSGNSERAMHSFVTYTYIETVGRVEAIQRDDCKWR